MINIKAIEFLEPLEIVELFQETQWQLKLAAAQVRLLLPICFIRITGRKYILMLILSNNS